jgi:hypothetical protein
MKTININLNGENFIIQYEYTPFQDGSYEEAPTPPSVRIFDIYTDESEEAFLNAKEKEAIKEMILESYQ